MYRITIPYNDQKEELRSGRAANRRGKGRAAIVSTALRRLHYDRDFIRRVKAALPSPKVEKPEEAPSKKRKKRRHARKTKGSAD